MPEHFIIVHGSAAEAVAHPERGIAPRDIDVITNAAPKEVEGEVRQWAARAGLPGGLPLDVKTEFEYGGEVRVPVPWRRENLHAIALRGDVTPKPAVARGLASLIRSGLPPTEIAAVAASQLWPLTVAPAPGETGEWDEYVGGLRGLRSAVTKYPEAWAACSKAPWWKLVDRLLREGVHPTEERLEWLRNASPRASGGAAIVSLLPRPKRWWRRRKGGTGIATYFGRVGVVGYDDLSGAEAGTDLLAKKVRTAP